MSNYTPGPWKLWAEVHPNEPNRSIVLMPEKADSGHGHQYAAIGGGNVKANAVLIAAAPDMLEALQHVLGELDVKGISLAVRYHVEDAIAKAQGEVTT